MTVGMHTHVQEKILYILHLSPLNKPKLPKDLKKSESSPANYKIGYDDDDIDLGRPGIKNVWISSLSLSKTISNGYW